jgi:DNA-binding response OmpR family regulator
VINPGRRSVKVGDRPVRLSKKEFTLLRALASDPTRVFSEEELLRDVWGFTGPPKSTRTLDSHASRVRRKLDPDHQKYVVKLLGGKGGRPNPDSNHRLRRCKGRLHANKNRSRAASSLD